MPYPVCEVLLTDRAIGAPAAALPAESGAIVDFWGVVRGNEDGAEISGIEYEAHRTMAEHQLRDIAEQGVRDFRLKQVRIEHRVGFVPVGEASLLVRVCSQHRAAAFRGSAWMVEELKKRAPIWKHPSFVKPVAEEACGSVVAVAHR